MAVNAPNPSLFLQQITNDIVGIRNDFDDLVNKLNYINSMGGATFLEAAAPNGLGMTAPDASALLASLGNHIALNAVYHGGTQGAALDYCSNGQPLWGGL